MDATSLQYHRTRLVYVRLIRWAEMPCIIWSQS